MGMFDSFYDANGDEWQTKAFGRHLSRWSIGDTVPGAPPIDFQVEVFGGPWGSRDWEDSLATISGGRVAIVPDQRHGELPLLDYHGGWIAGSASQGSCVEDANT